MSGLETEPVGETKSIHAGPMNGQLNIARSYACVPFRQHNELGARRFPDPRSLLSTRTASLRACFDPRCERLRIMVNCRHFTTVPSNSTTINSCQVSESTPANALRLRCRHGIGNLLEISQSCQRLSVWRAEKSVHSLFLQATALREWPSNRCGSACNSGRLRTSTRIGWNSPVADGPG